MKATSLHILKFPISVLILWFALLNTANAKLTTKESPTTSAFNPKTATWDIAWPGRVSQYDLVYLSPPIDPMQGIPLGNGEIGALFWCEDSKIIAVINKSDLWDDAAFGPFHNWDGKEEDVSTTQRHACRIIIDFKYPVFNTLYISDFKAKLNLADGSLSLEGSSPFGQVGLRAFVDHKTGTLLYELKSDLKENVPVDITVERFGSRTFSHWYHQINRDATIGTTGTESFADKNGVSITQKLSSGTFAIGGSVLKNNGSTVTYSRDHSHAATIQLAGKQQKDAQLAFSVTSPTKADPTEILRKNRQAINDLGLEAFRQANAGAWKEIWNRSLMDYGDDYLNSLWYLTMFYANASQGGNYPGRFNNGIWSWSRDVQNWNFYFHWNQQQISWPLNAAGFHELVTPYLDFRFNSLPEAKKDAKKLFNANGAFVSDVTERRGYNSSGEKINHTPIAEIALDFWRQYKFTNDKKFLQEKALPFILEAARFYESILVKEADGQYHAKEGSGYEGWIKLKDGLTELVYAQALFTAALDAMKVAGSAAPESIRWRDILNHLAPLPILKYDEETIGKTADGYKLKRGFFRGETSPTNEIFAAGWGIKEQQMLVTYNLLGKSDTIKDRNYPNNGLKLLDGIFPSVPSSPVFPSGVIGLANKGNQRFDHAKATTLLYGAEITGWDPVPIVMARLGMAKELAIDLERFPSRWQIYLNGWGHWGLEVEVNKDAEWFFRTNQVVDVNSKAKDEKFPLPMWPFRHMSMEATSVLTTAMNESLLQSYNDIVRVFPAFPANKSGRFTLHAQGGFIVSSEIQSGQVQWISIKSLYGNKCNLALPWKTGVAQSSLKRSSQMLKEPISIISTKINEVITIVPEGKNSNSWTIVGEKPIENEKVKYHSSGKTQLGIPRMY